MGCYLADMLMALLSLPQHPGVEVVILQLPSPSKAPSAPTGRHRGISLPRPSLWPSAVVVSQWRHRRWRGGQISHGVWGCEAVRVTGLRQSVGPRNHPCNPGEARQSVRSNTTAMVFSTTGAIVTTDRAQQAIACSARRWHRRGRTAKHQIPKPKPQNPKP